MKKFLSYGGASLIVSGLLDPVIQIGLDKPVQWGRDLFMGISGVVFLYLLYKFRDQL